MIMVTLVQKPVSFFSGDRSWDFTASNLGGGTDAGRTGQESDTAGIRPNSGQIKRTEGL